MTVYGLQYDAASARVALPGMLRACYVNGLYAMSPVIYGIGRVWVDVNGTDPDKAKWGDVEKGAMTPAMVGEWLDQRAEVAGEGNGGIYCGGNNLPAVLSNIGDRKANLWFATLDGTTNPILSLPANVTLCAVQAFPASMVGMQCDISVVVNEIYWDTYAAA